MARRLPITASLHVPEEKITAAAEVLASRGATPAPRNAIVSTQPWQGGWQKEAWAYRDTVGELRYASVFMANAASRVKLTLATLDADSDEWVELYDEDDKLRPGVDKGEADKASAALAALGQQHGGHGPILSGIAENLFIAGECYLLGLDDEWSVRSTDELRQVGTRWHETNLNGSGSTEIPGEPFVARIYRPHPRYHRLADSPVRACLDILDELVLLTRQVRSAATSRIAGAGVYWIPSEISFTDDEGSPSQSFERRFMDAMMRPISQHGSASEVVPMIARASAAFIKDIRHDTFDTHYGEHIGALRDEAIRRLASGLDLPLEVVLGQGGSSHWSAWMVDESLYKAHLAPFMAMITDALTTAYLWPALNPDGRPSKVRIKADATELIQHPNREQAARMAYGDVANPNFGISGETFRRLIGVGDEAKPDDDEIADRIRQAQLVRTTLRITEAGGFAQLLSEEGQDINEASEDGSQMSSPMGLGTPEATVKGPPPMPVAPPATHPATQAMSAAAELAAFRVLERLGERVRGRVRTDPALATATKGLAASAVPAALGLHSVEDADGADIVEDEMRALVRFCAAQGWNGQTSHVVARARSLVAARLAS